MKVKSQSAVKVTAFIFACILIESGCSSHLPSEQQFKDWIKVIYTHETGLKADRIYIDSWERTAKEVYEKFPGLDGLDVEAMIITLPDEDRNSTDIERLGDTKIHYVICRYLKFNDKWSLHASNWGGGYWKEDPKKWAYLVERCKNEVVRFRSDLGADLMKKK